MSYAWKDGPVPDDARIIANLKQSNERLREALQDAQREGRARKFASFWRGSIFGAILATGAFVASAAFGETISIGTLYTHGEAGKATTVTITPSDVPGQLAIVTLQNNYVNQGADNGDYSLTLDGMTVGVRFFWDASPVTGADQITLTPPAGINCLPVDCTVTVPEGMSGQIILLDYLGF